MFRLWYQNKQLMSSVQEIKVSKNMGFTWVYFSFPQLVTSDCCDEPRSCRYYPSSMELSHTYFSVFYLSVHAIICMQLCKVISVWARVFVCALSLALSLSHGVLHFGPSGVRSGSNPLCRALTVKQWHFSQKQRDGGGTGASVNQKQNLMKTYRLCAVYTLHSAYVGGPSSELIRCVICMGWKRGCARNMWEICLWPCISLSRCCTSCVWSDLDTCWRTGWGLKEIKPFKIKHITNLHFHDANDKDDCFSDLRLPFPHVNKDVTASTPTKCLTFSLFWSRIKFHI